MSASVSGGSLVGEKRKLRKVLRRVDLVLFTACAMVSLDTIAFSASIGGEALFWLAASFVFFLIPYGLLTAELGSAFPVEGGPYEWAKMSFGRLPAAVTAVLYWLCNPIWVGGTLAATAIATLEAFFHHGEAYGTGAEIVFGLIFVWLTVAVAIAALRYGKWAPNVGTILKAIVALLFTGLWIAYLAQGKHHGSIAVSDVKPSVTGFLALIGVLAFVWGGFEVSSNASEEMLDPQRDVPWMVVRAGAVGAVLYGLVILGTLLVIPKAQLSNVGGFTDAYNRVAGVLGGSAGGVGKLVAVLIVLTLFSSGAVWLEGADRAQAVAALDGAAPAWMGRFASFGTPIAVNLASGVVGSVFVFLGFLLTKGKLADFFGVMIALTASTATLAYLFVFPALVVLRKKYPDAHRPYRVPGGMLGAWICVILTELVVVLTGFTLLWPGLIDGLLGRSYDIQASWGVSRAFFESVTLGSFAVLVVIGVVFWRIGERNRARGIAGEPEPVGAVAASAPEIG